MKKKPDTEIRMMYRVGDTGSYNVLQVIPFTQDGIDFAVLDSSADPTVLLCKPTPGIAAHQKLPLKTSIINLGRNIDVYWDKIS